MNNRVTIDISILSILRVFGVLLGLWLLYQIRDIVLLLFIVIIVVMSLAPIVNRWQAHMPRAVAVGLLFAIILGVISLIVSLLLPPVISQVSDLSVNLPNYTRQIEPLFNNLNSNANELSFTQRALQGLSDQLNSLSQGLVSTTLGFLGGLVSFVTIVVLSIYLLFEERGIRNFLSVSLPIERKEPILNAIDKIGDKLGAWLRGQLSLMAIVGVMVALLTSALGLPYALTLGLWSGLTEIVPYIGPVIGGIPVVLIAFLDSPLKAIIALVVLILIQQIESNFIVPKVMQRSVGLSPVIVILALLIGGKLFGIAGTILSVPVAATISVIIEEWPKLSRKRSTKEAE